MLAALFPLSAYERRPLHDQRPVPGELRPERGRRAGRLPAARPQEGRVPLRARPPPPCALAPLLERGADGCRAPPPLHHVAMPQEPLVHPAVTARLDGRFPSPCFLHAHLPRHPPSAGTAALPRAVPGHAARLLDSILRRHAGTQSGQSPLQRCLPPARRPLEAATAVWHLLLPAGLWHGTDEGGPPLLSEPGRRCRPGPSGAE